MHSARISYGQIATILTLIIAAIFVFTVIILNMRKVTQRKAMLDNAADGAALFLASSVGSLGNKLAHEYLGVDKNGNVKTEACNWDIVMLINIALLIASIVATILIPGSGLVGVAATVANIARSVATGVAIAAGLGLGGNVAHMIAIEPKQFQNFSLYFKQMTAEQQLLEGAIQYAAFSVMDDTAEVLDKYDDTGNGRTDDKILRLTQAYYQRLRGLPALGPRINTYFIGPLRSFVSVEEDPDTWEVKKVQIPDYPLAPQRAFGDWLEKDFIDLLQLLENTGYGVSFWGSGDENDDVDRLISDIADFEKYAYSILAESPDQRLVSFEQWYKQLYPNDDEIGWQMRLVVWQGYLRAWIAELLEIQGRVQECINGCENNKYLDCCNPHPCPPPEDDGDTGDGTTPLPTDNPGDSTAPSQDTTSRESGNLSLANLDGGDCCDGSGCCGEKLTCCSICGDPCAPGKCCSTCCRIQDNCDSATSKIVRAVFDHLIPFQNRLHDFVESLPAFKAQVDDYYTNLSKSLWWGYEWTDSAGYHKAKVSLKDPKEDKPLDIKGGPYILPDRTWWTLWTQKCVHLKNYEGDFRVVVSRYDNEQAKGIKGILELLNWNKTITSEVKAHYGINKGDIRIIQRIR